MVELWGYYLFLNDNRDENIVVGRVCVRTQWNELIKEDVDVTVGKEKYCVHVQEIENWLPILDKEEEDKVDENDSVEGVDDAYIIGDGEEFFDSNSLIVSKRTRRDN
ncbi:hypothetical protein L1987_74099 [Smallanthus sonchifolius]|uniref:Uncharacterized protein n=1 Tax=Smallanthus sonchifolius TaxID=185202 RepID=A0ACB9A215_9ASTR|nr:hypothetical protein L1987_74099 [Smallanthus sonchifolius]